MTKLDLLVNMLLSYWFLLWIVVSAAAKHKTRFESILKIELCHNFFVKVEKKIETKSFQNETVHESETQVHYKIR